MELGNFQKSVDSDEIKTMAFEIIGEPVKAVSRICEQWGEAEDEVRDYDVYVIETDAGKYTLKKTGSKEAQIYVQYLSKGEFHVPQYVGMPDTTSYPLFCEQFAASIASTSNNAGISLLGLSYSMTYVSPQLRSFLCTWTTALQASYTS